MHPEYREVVKTYLSFLDAEIVEIPLKEGGADIQFLEKNLDQNTAAVILQQPNFFGALEVFTMSERLRFFADFPPKPACGGCRS